MNCFVRLGNRGWGWEGPANSHCLLAVASGSDLELSDLHPALRCFGAHRYFLPSIRRLDRGRGTDEDMAKMRELAKLLKTPLRKWSLRAEAVPA